MRITQVEVKLTSDEGESYLYYMPCTEDVVLEVKPVIKSGRDQYWGGVTLHGVDTVEKIDFSLTCVATAEHSDVMINATRLS